MKKITTGWVIVGMLVLIGLYAWYLLRGGGEPSHYILTFPDGTRIVAETARSDAERFLGLIFKDKLPEGMGMLFIFDEPDRHRLWTKNARFPIDIIWLDSNGHVVGWEENLSPCRQDPCPTYAPPKPALYALEIPTGFVQQHGLKTDMAVAFALPKS